MRNVMWLLLLGAAFFGLVIACGGSGDNPAGVGSGKGRILAGADQEAYGDPPTVYITSPEDTSPPYEINELRTTIEGYATSCDYSVLIDRVEIKVNDGDWKEAYLLGEPYFYRTWCLNISLTEGTNTVYARAYDEDERVSSLDSVDIEVDMSGLEDGDVLWKYVPENGYSLGNNAIIKNGKVYASSSIKMYCLDLDDGEPIWTIDADEGIYFSDKCPAITDDEERLFFYSTAGTFYCYDITSNPPTLEWSKAYTTVDITAGPFVNGDRVYVTLSDAVRSYYIPDPDDENHPPVVFQMPGYIGSPYSMPSLYDGKLYVTSRNEYYPFDYNVMRCFDLDGEQEWEYSYWQDEWSTNVYANPLISSEGGVFPGFALYPRAGFLDTADGSLVWAEMTASNVINVAYYHNTTNNKSYVFPVDVYAHTYCYDAETGEKLWDWVNGMPTSYGTAYANGRLYVNSNIGLHCFNSATGTLLWLKFPANNGIICGISENKMILGGGICVNLPSSNSASKDWPTVGQNNRRTNSFIDDAGWPMSPGDIVWTIESEDFESIYSMHVTYATDSQGTKKILFVAGNYNYTNAKLYCYEADPYTDTPQECWSFSLGNKYLPAMPIINGDNIYIAGYGHFYCLSLLDGSSVWKDQYDNDYSYEFESYAYRAPVYADGKIYFATNNAGGSPLWLPGVYCINASNGSEVWTYQNAFGAAYPYGNIVNDIAYSPNGYIYVISYLNVGGGSTVACLNAETGNEEWVDPRANSTGGGVIVSGGKVYVTRSSGIYCYDDSSTKSLEWSNTTYGGGYTPPVIDGDYLYMRVNGGGYIRRFAKSNGAVDTNFQYIRATGYGSFYGQSGISVSNGYLYVGLSDWVSPFHSMIRCYNIAENVSGAPDLGLEWTADTGDGDVLKNAIRAGITIVPSTGFAYTGSYNGKIYCIYAPECVGGADWHFYSHDDTHTGTVTGE